MHVLLERLFRLYSRHRSNIPLEDFTTEVLASLLQTDKIFSKRYLQLIGLPADCIYEVKTQQFYTESRQNCFVDVVLESTHTICFIENKVNSGEGLEQLDRYATVLERDYPQKQKHLVYCTKFREEKSVTKPDITFRTCNWHDIGKLIADTSGNAVDFYNHLKRNEMTNNYTITPELLAASKKAAEIEIVFLHYLEEVKNDFWLILGNRFPRNQTDCITEKGTQYRQDLKMRNRFANICNGILGQERPYSELIYGVDFERSELFVGFYVEHAHSRFIEVEESINLCLKMTVRKFDIGTEFRFVKSLGELLNKEEAEQLTSTWFREHFQILYRYVRKESQLPWVIQD